MRPTSSTAGYKLAVRRAICRRYNVVTFCSRVRLNHGGLGEAVPGVVVAVYVDPSAIERHVGSAICSMH